MQPLKRLAFMVVVVLFVPAVVMTGCGGSGSSPTGSLPCVQFTPSAGSSPGTVTTSVDPASTCDILILNVNVAGVDNLWGSGTKVRFPTALLTYLGVDDAGSVLMQGGVPVITFGNENPLPVVDLGTGESEATVGVTRASATASGVDIGVNPELLFKVLFARRGTSGSGSIIYVNEVLRDAQSPPVVIGGVTWHGGMISIN